MDGTEESGTQWTQKHDTAEPKAQIMDDCLMQQYWSTEMATAAARSCSAEALDAWSHRRTWRWASRVVPFSSMPRSCPQWLPPGERSADPARGRAGWSWCWSIHCGVPQSGWAARLSSPSSGPSHKEQHSRPSQKNSTLGRHIKNTTMGLDRKNSTMCLDRKTRTLGPHRKTSILGLHKRKALWGFTERKALWGFTERTAPWAFTERPSLWAFTKEKHPGASQKEQHSQTSQKEQSSTKLFKTYSSKGKAHSM